MTTAIWPLPATASSVRWEEVISGLAPWPCTVPGVSAALRWLADEELGTGARIVIDVDHQPALPALLQACLISGVIPVLIHRRLPEAQRRQQLSATTPHARIIRELPDTWLSDATERPPTISATPRDPDATALICFSSGSTGQPRAIALSIQNILHAAAVSAQHLRLSPTDQWLTCLPLDHIGGTMSIFRAAASGCTVHLCERFDPAAITTAIDQHGITGIGVVPTMLHRLIEERQHRPWPQDLRCILSGGAALDTTLSQASAQLGRRPCRSYGATESAAMICAQDPAGEAGPHCGRPLAGAEIHLSTDDVITLNGPQVARGQFISGRWNRTTVPWVSGDRGYFDADGRLHIVGRQDTRITSGGEKIQPELLEAALIAHPAVIAVATFGVPDPEWGEALAAALIINENDLPAVQSWARKHLAGHQVPKHWLRVHELPLTERGKVDTQALAALVRTA